jgi:transposase-like protein
MMNALERIPKAKESQLQRALRRVWDEAETHAEARAELGALAESLAAEHPELAGWLEVEGEETLSCFHFPPGHRRRARTTNGNERVNQD